MTEPIDSSTGVKRRTLLQIMFCPGGGTGTATPAAVRSIDVNTNHARSPLAGVQQVLDAPADFKVERLEGDLRPGGRLAGRIAATRARTMWTADFDLTLPMKDAAAGMTCKR